MDFFHSIGVKIIATISGILLLFSGAQSVPNSPTSPNPSEQSPAVTQSVPAPARYEITVVNDFFAEPIKLTTGTRFETATGNTFHAESAFTVPGKKVGEKNGEIVITVVSDNPRSAPAGKLTLPGFDSSGSYYAHIYALAENAEAVPMPTTADSTKSPQTSVSSSPKPASPVAPLIIQSSGGAIDEATLNSKLSILKNDLLSRISQSNSGGGYAPVYVNQSSGDFVTRDFFSKQVDSIYNHIALMSRIDQLSGIDLSDITVDGVSGLTDADIPDGITASNYLALTGGTLAGDLTVTGNFNVAGAQTLSGAITIPYLTATSSTPSLFAGKIGIATSSVGTIGTSTASAALTVNGNLYLAGSRGTLYFRGDNALDHVGGLQFDALNYGATTIITPTNNSGTTLDSTIKFGGGGSFNSNIVNLTVSGTTTSANFSSTGNITNAGGYYTNKAIAYSGTGASMANTNFFANSTATGSCTGGNCPLNSLFYNSDTRTGNLNSIMPILKLYENFGGGSARGNFTGLDSTLYLTGATQNTNGQYVSVLMGGAMGANDNGTSGTPAGSFWGFNSNVVLQPAATYYNGINGGEIDVAVMSGASVAHKIGVSIVQTTVDAVSGTLDDSAITIANQLPAGSGTPGWTTGLSFGENDGYQGIKPTGTLIGTTFHNGESTMGTVANGIDFSGYTFSNKFLKSNGFSVDGSGNVTQKQASSTQLSVFQKSYFGGTATSTFDSAGVLTLASALGITSGGTGASTFGQGWIFSSGGSGALSASTSPTVNYITATSTTVASNFASFINTSGTTGGYKIDNNLVLQASSTNALTAGGISALANYFNTSSTAGETAFGYQTLQNATSSTFDTAIGYKALKSSATVSSAGGNTAVGYQVLTSNSSGASNGGFGTNALVGNTTGSFNNAFGNNALNANTTGGNNSAFGHFALSTNQTGSSNSAFGSAAALNTTGSSNSAFGNNALNGNTSGGFNAAFGATSLFINTGSNNTAAGYRTFRYQTSGSGNTALGYQAGTGLTDISDYNTVTDTNMTFLGFEASRDSSVASTSALTNGTAIGYLATVGCSNCLVLGGTGGNAVKTGIASTTPWKTLSVVGTMAVNGLTAGAGAGSLCLTSNKEVVYSDNAGCTGSSQRFKHDIVSLDATSGIEEAMKLRPVSFVYNDDIGVKGPQVGFIAEDVMQVDPRLATYDASGTPNNVKYTNMVAIAIKAIQEIANISGAFKDTLVAWLGSATNGIGDFFANRIIGNQLCAKKSDGTLACVTGDQLASAVHGGSSSSPVSNSNNSSTTPDTEPPIITINGSNPAEINVGDTYSDLGASVSDNVDHDLGIHTFVGNTPIEFAAIDTSASATYHINYVATDSAGNTATSTRTVIVKALDGQTESQPEASGSSTESASESSPPADAPDTPPTPPTDTPPPAPDTTPQPQQ